METIKSSAFNAILKPTNRSAANAAFSVKQWTRFMASIHMKCDLQTESGRETAYQHLINFVRFVDDNATHSAYDSQKYLEYNLNITDASSLRELFTKENLTVLKTIGFSMSPFIKGFKASSLSSYMGTPGVTHVEEPKVEPKSNVIKLNCDNNEGKRTYNSTGNFMNTDIDMSNRKAPEQKEQHDFNKKYNHVIPNFQRLDARVDPNTYCVVYDATGNTPFMMCRIDEKHINMKKEEWIKDGYNNAIRYAYAQQFGGDCCNVRIMSLSFYQAGRYRRIAKIYNRPAYNMPGIKTIKSA